MQAHFYDLDVAETDDTGGEAIKAVDYTEKSVQFFGAFDSTHSIEASMEEDPTDDDFAEVLPGITAAGIYELPGTARWYRVKTVNANSVRPEKVTLGGRLSRSDGG